MTTGLRPILSDKPAEQHEERRADRERTGDQQIGRRRVDLEYLRQEEQRVELARSTTRPPAPPSGRTARAVPRGAPVLREEALASAALWNACPPPSSAGTAATRSVAAESTRRSPTEAARNQERNAPAPGFEGLRRPASARHARTTSSDRNSPGVAVVWMKLVCTPRLSGRRMLGHVSRCASVLAAQRQALQQAQRDERYRRQHADARVTRQKADEERRGAHDDDGALGRCACAP